MVVEFVDTIIVKQPCIIIHEIKNTGKPVEALAERFCLFWLGM